MANVEAENQNIGGGDQMKTAMIILFGCAFTIAIIFIIAIGYSIGAAIEHYNGSPPVACEHPTKF